MASDFECKFKLEFLQVLMLCNDTSSLSKTLEVALGDFVYYVSMFVEGFAPPTRGYGEGGDEGPDHLGGSGGRC